LTSRTVPSLYPPRPFEDIVTPRSRLGRSVALRNALAPDLREPRLWIAFCAVGLAKGGFEEFTLICRKAYACGPIQIAESIGAVLAEGSLPLVAYTISQNSPGSFRRGGSKARSSTKFRDDHRWRRGRESATSADNLRYSWSRSRGRDRVERCNETTQIAGTRCNEGSTDRRGYPP